MRTIKLEHDECAPGGSGCVDWKASPMEVLCQMDDMLHDLMAEIVIYETGDDSYVWSIEAREE